ncbi:BTB/POZ domain-containing protein kctd15-like [Pollicipes pollicipes]|uniref:BTB/POZ domain-containing protein kctd15-like n=1 Tax=Pollicipes pollicipes TaxID=41117 RepID=UPI0018853679|nr:BTB/POZ domain-containing protein kctd15-like [Pollicipes pollicipes]
MQVERMITKANTRLISPAGSPNISPGSLHSSSPTPLNNNKLSPSIASQPKSSPTVASHHGKVTGIPTVAAASRYTAPVHIDVGGVIYTSSLETLTRFPETRLAKLFNGQVPIVLDTLKQHYFIDRDGKMFRHILNFMRSGKVCVPDDFSEIDCLMEEARYFEVQGMVKQLEQLRRQRAGRSTARAAQAAPLPQHGYHVVALHISPDLGERVMLSGERKLIEETFPEVVQALMDSRTSVAWNQADPEHVVRFPLNGYIKMTSLQAIQRLLADGFQIVASLGGGVEGQQFSEYIFSRSRLPL